MVAQRLRRAAALSVLLGAGLVAGCVGLPAGPRVQVMQGTSSPPEYFRADDAACRQWVVGVLGPNSVYASEGEAQWRYDQAYVQCMYAHGHAVPSTMVPILPGTRTVTVQ